MLLNRALWLRFFQGGFTWFLLMYSSSFTDVWGTLNLNSIIDLLIAFQHECIIVVLDTNLRFTSSSKDGVTHDLLAGRFMKNLISSEKSGGCTWVSPRTWSCCQVVAIFFSRKRNKNLRMSPGNLGFEQISEWVSGQEIKQGRTWRQKLMQRSWRGAAWFASMEI